MCTDRRDFLRLSAFAAGATLLSGSLIEAGAEPLQQGNQPEAIRRLRRMTDSVVPISLDERKARIEKARKLMRDNRIDAIYVEPGTSMLYYTGMRWGTSERMLAMVIPEKGDIAWVCPKFEEERAREHERHRERERPEEGTHDPREEAERHEDHGGGKR